jgi:penicillin-binding protein 2
MFGLDEPPGIELPLVFEGLVPDREWKKERLKEAWYRGDTVNYSIGQGFLLVSPLQVLRLVAAFADKGELNEITLIKDKKVASRKVEVSAPNLTAVRQAMRSVVEDPQGTGKHARVAAFEIAAKTGTAENPQGKAHAWFAGFFPYHKPRYAIVCMIEHGGAGGMVAGTLTREILTAWQEKEGIDLG